MARFHVTSNWRATSAFVTFLVFAGVLALATITQERMGVMLYVLAFAAIGLGFWAREDNSAMGGIIGLNILVVLDIALRIGVLP